jgi:hypothetical protein
MSHLGYVTRQTRVSEVSAWSEDYSSDVGTVWSALNIFGFYKVKLNGKTKYYKGELAESNIERAFRDAGDWNCRV